jgi:hypothetical protein
MLKNELPGEISSDAQKPIKILIAGLARNCRTTLVPSIRQLQTLFGPDVSLSYFLVESDSTDGTQQLLEKLAREIPGFNYKALGNLEPEIPSRILRIAHCRNQYLGYLRDQLTSGGGIEYLVVADFDGVNSRISPRQTVEKLFSRSTIVSANQKGRYYDILALRASSWVEEDYRTSISQDSTNVNRFTGYLNFVSLKQRRISKNEPPIQVESAFGGLTIYPAQLLDGCKYEPKELSPGIWECEHVGFNAQALKNGGQIIILPNLRNKGPIGHTLFASLLPRFVVKGLVALGKRRDLRSQ